MTSESLLPSHPPEGSSCWKRLCQRCLLVTADSDSTKRSYGFTTYSLLFVALRRKALVWKIDGPGDQLSPSALLNIGNCKLLPAMETDVPAMCFAMPNAAKHEQTLPYSRPFTNQGQASS